MGRFERLYGISRKKIKPHCIISPLNEARLFSGLQQSATQGALFRIAQTEYATIISPRYNLLAGDCVLGLKDTACRNLYLFGSCGALQGLKIADLVLVRKSYNFESFSDMLRNKNPQKAIPADARLMKEVPVFLQGRMKLSLDTSASSFDTLRTSLSIIDCATVNSLFLEEKYTGIFKRKGISCVDMESSLVFSAAGYIRRRAVALMYVSDIILKKPFYNKMHSCDYQRIEHARRRLAGLLAEFIRTHETCYNP